MVCCFAPLTLRSKLCMSLLDFLTLRGAFFPFPPSRRFLLFLLIHTGLFESSKPYCKPCYNPRFSNGATTEKVCILSACLVSFCTVASGLVGARPRYPAEQTAKRPTECETSFCQIRSNFLPSLYYTCTRKVVHREKQRSRNAVQCTQRL